MKVTAEERNYVEGVVANLTLNGNCFGGRIPSAEGVLDSYWPDYWSSRRSTWQNGWNSAEVDEQGPIGLFAATIDNLQANNVYNFEIRPIGSPSFEGNVKPTILKASTRKADESD